MMFLDIVPLPGRKLCLPKVRTEFCGVLETGRQTETNEKLGKTMKWMGKRNKCGEGKGNPAESSRATAGFKLPPAAIDCGFSGGLTAR